jgi:hypothetical protein
VAYQASGLDKTVRNQNRVDSSEPFGGDWPRLRRDDTGIFLLNPDNKLMTAMVNGRGARFEVGGVRALFQTRKAGQNYPYAVSAILCHPISIADNLGFAEKRLGIIPLRCFTGQSRVAVLGGLVPSRNLFGKPLSQDRGRYGFTLAGYAVTPQNAHAFSSEKPPMRSASMPEQK